MSALIASTPTVAVTPWTTSEPKVTPRPTSIAVIAASGESNTLANRKMPWFRTTPRSTSRISYDRSRNAMNEREPR